MHARDPPARHAALEVAAGELPDREQLVDPELRGRVADLAVVRRCGAAELGHVAEDGHTTAVAAPLDEVCERRAHRDGIRVVCVVDQQPAARQLVLVAAPAREVGVDRGRPWQPEGVERRQCGSGVPDRT